MSDIGDEFGGVTLTPDAYLIVENAYVESAIAFLAESNIHSLRISGLENSGNYTSSELKLSNGISCSLLEIADITRLNLRSLIWCRLVGEDAFLHFGWDYYMYLGVPSDCPVSIQFAENSGLFVEPFRSPYLDD